MKGVVLSKVPTAPLVGVSAGLLFAVLPLLDRIAPWAIAIFGGALLVRILVNRLHLTLPGLATKVGVLAVGLGGIAASYRTMLGIEPGLGMLLILISLKLLETNSVRDFQVLTLLGWFLSLCTLFFSQTLGSWLYIGAVCALLIGSLVHFHRGGHADGFVTSARVVFTLLLQAAPIILLLFLFFPRTHASFRVTFNRAFSGTSGMSDRLEPGSISTLAMNNEPAFRVGFPDGNVPPLPLMYWRGGVLWQGEGLVWSRGGLSSVERFRRLEGPIIRQRIVLEPHGERWLLALDRPAQEDVPRTTVEPGGYLQSVKPVITRMSYEVFSRPENREMTLLPEHRLAALSKPAGISPRVQALVASWRANATGEREIIDAALRYFRTHRFTYTLSPGTYGADSLDDFLFNRRSGFCEHYAAAFATLMRLANIPARIVIGYHGGQLNRSYVIVSQSDAHAWCEVWQKNSGWQRVDPTNVIAPDRISSGFESFMESRAAAEDQGVAGRSTSATGLREIVRDLRLFWDSLNYQWDLRVLNYDEESQGRFFAVIGLDAYNWRAVTLWIVALAVAFLTFIALWLNRAPRPRRDAAIREYERFCGILAAAGVSRDRAEGPVRFAERAAEALPSHAEVIRRAGDLYVRLRYSKAAPPLRDFVREVRTLRRRRLRR